MTYNKDNIHYVYAHIREDTGEIFYIGIGVSPNFKRAYSKDKRNRIWRYIVNKSSYTVKILFIGLSHQQSINKEIRLIKLIGRKNLKQGTLCNLTDGGEGCINYIATQETREKLRVAGLKRRSTDETKLKLSSYHKSIGISSEKQAKMLAGRVIKGWIGLGNKKVLCTVTNKQFDSIKEAALFYNMNRHWLARMLRGERKNRTSMLLST